jgi:hypothetical protein
VEAIRQKPVKPERCGTDAKALVGLWRALGRPPPADFATDIAAVAQWAREAPDKQAARDIRAEGWADGVDRSRSVATLSRRDRWADRLDAARAWRARQDAPAAGPAPADDPAAAWQAVRAIVTSRERRQLDLGDARATLLAKIAVRNLGGREAVFGNIEAAAAGWRAAYADAARELDARLQKNP